MPKHQKEPRDNAAGRLLLTAGIAWALYEYPPASYASAYSSPYFGKEHFYLWWFGVACVCLGLLPVLGAAFKTMRYMIGLFQIFGHNKSKGSSGWMSEKDIRKHGLHVSKRGRRFIGTVGRTALWLYTETHHLILGPAGSQKTTAAIMNFLMGCKESALVTDIKGELWLTTKQHRETKLGHRCVKIDPKDPANSVKINPLAQIAREVANNDPAALTRTRGMMLQLYPDPKGGGGGNDVFYKGARSLMVTTVLAVVVVLPKAHQNLAMVYRALSDMDILHDLLGKASESTVLNGEVADMARALHEAAFGDGPAAKSFESFRTNALLALEAFGPGNYLAAITSETTFEFSELKERPTTLYILIDYSNSAVLGQFSGLMQWMAADAMVAAKNNVPVLFVLDEFCNNPLHTLPKILTLLRSAGVKCILVTQDLDDITRVYDAHALETVLSETDIKQVLGGIRSRKTLEYFSNYLGDITQVGSNFNLGDGQLQESVSYGNRKLLSPDELQRLPSNAQIVLYSNHFPILALKCQVFAIAPWRWEIGINTQYSTKRKLLPVDVRIGWWRTKVTSRAARAYRKIERQVLHHRESRWNRVRGYIFTAIPKSGALLLAIAVLCAVYSLGLPNLRFEYGYRQSAQGAPITYVWCRYIGPTAPGTVRGPHCPLILWRKSW